MKFVNLIEDFNRAMNIEDEEEVKKEILLDNCNEECEDCDDQDEAIDEDCKVECVEESLEINEETTDIIPAEPTEEIVSEEDAEVVEQTAEDVVVEDEDACCEEECCCEFLDMRKLAHDTIQKCIENNFTRIEAISEIINQVNQAMLLSNNRDCLDACVDAAYTKAGIPVADFEDEYFADKAEQEAPEEEIDPEADIDLADLEFFDF